MVKESLHVLIVDDRSCSRKGLRALLSTVPHLEVIAEATDGWQAVRLVEELLPDMVLMDIRMPTMDGLEATRIIKARWPYIKIIVLTLHATYRYDALNSKADAFVCKGDPPERLVATIQDLLQEETN